MNEQPNRKQEIIPKSYNLKILILSIIVAIVAVVMLNRIIARKTEDFQDLVSILVAREDIPKGTIIERPMVARQEIPAEFFSKNYVRTADLEKIIALKTTVDIMKGDPLSKNYFSVEMVETGLSSKIPENNRAITINVSNVSGMAGMLQPNDRVDILGTFDISYGSGKSGTITKLLLQNLSILAVGNVTSDEYIMEQSKLGFGKARSSSRRQYSTVTLKVSLEEAELITFADRHGDLRLLLRRWDDENVLEDLKEVDFDDLFENVKKTGGTKIQPKTEKRAIHYER